MESAEEQAEKRRLLELLGDEADVQGNGKAAAGIAAGGMKMGIQERK